MAHTGKISARTIWGKVVLFLKEHRQVALHVACGDITDVSVSENFLIVHVKDSMLLTLLSDGRREIENALRWQGLDIQLKIEYIPKEKSEQEKDIDILGEVLGEYLIIKEK